MKQIIVILASLLLFSCTSESGKRITRSTADSAKYHIDMVQVMHIDSSIDAEGVYVVDNGRVENIKDHLNLRPRLFDTLIVLDLNTVHNKDLTTRYEIYGKYNGQMPPNVVNDSVEVFYHKVVVIKTVVEK